MEKNVIKIIDTYDLLRLTMMDNDYSYDIYFRMAVIEKYLNNENDIWDLYNEMQYTRCNMIKNIPDYMKNNQNNFISLIKSIKHNGFDINKPILINNKGMIIDGAHRLACALFFDIPKVSIITNDEYYSFIPREYSKNWFIKNNLKDCIMYADFQKSKIKEKICLNQKKC